jgi:hypothetical protein
MSLIETLFAAFILLVAMTVFGTLFQNVLRSSRRGDELATAARVANNRLEEIRDWARTASGSSSNFRSGSWATWATPYADPSAPGFNVSVSLVAQACYSPSIDLEAGFAAPRSMTNSVKKLRLRTTWRDQQLDLWSEIAAPPQNPRLPLNTAIDVSTSLSGLIANGSGGTLTAQAIDDNGQAIPDLVYLWNILPGTGTGEVITQDRNGRNATFTNQGNVGPGPKDCQVSVTAYYRGQWLSGTSSSLSLESL